MKKYIAIVIVAAGILLLGGGILMQAVKNWDTEEKERRMTQEEFIEYFGFTEEEIEGIDIEKYLEKYAITRAYLIHSGSTKESTMRLLSRYPKKEPENMEGRKFSYVVYGEPLNGVTPDYDKIKYIAYQESDTMGYSVFIDVKARRIYVSPTSGQYVYHDISKAEVVLEEVDLSEVIECIRNLGLEKWKGSYEKNAVHAVSWTFGIEFEDGTIASYTGYGRFPEEYQELRRQMFSFD